MSDYQFDKYSIIRKNEIDRDKNSKKQKGKAKVIKGKNSKTNENSKGDISQVDPHIEHILEWCVNLSQSNRKTFKGDLKDMELIEVEDLELEQKLEDEYEMKLN